VFRCLRLFAALCTPGSKKMSDFHKRLATLESVDSKLEKDNARVTREWEALGDISGNDPRAIALAQRQAKRHLAILAHHGYHPR
jgi:hypothetical protein